MLETLSWFLDALWNVFKVAFGLGFVIFFHELGHFLLAKWNKVKVEKFSIGFGPTIVGITRGETEYVIAAVPLGGFVKMLGEEPEEEASKSTDPRAYNNKTVGARMAIISAGVIMNVFLGMACFVYAYGQGMVKMPARVGFVEPASPAYEAGMRSGDEIVAIDGRGDLSWNGMQLKVVLSGHGQVLRFEVRRPGLDRLVPLAIQPRREAGMDRPTIGVRPTRSLIVNWFVAPVGMDNPPEFPKSVTAEGTRPVETLVAVAPAGKDPIRVADIDEYHRLLARFRDQPLTHIIEGRDGPIDEPGKVVERIELTLPPAKVVDLGFRLAIEPISSVQRDSTADQAGFRKGDRIIKVNGSDDFDPMRLPSLCYENAGKPMTFEVERTSGDGSTRIETIPVTPDDTPPSTEEPADATPLSLPGLGLSFPVSAHIAKVRPGSPADRAELKSGQVVNSITFTLRKPGEAAATKVTASETVTTRQETISLDETPSGWVKAFWILQSRPYESVSLIVNKGSKPIELKPEPAPDWYLTSRGLNFVYLFQKLPPQKIAAALRRGWDDTVENILSIYGTIRNLILGRLGLGGVAGPLRIVGLAYETARSGFKELMSFLGILSLNLAVINFLPVPPLDGGQMLFLIAEKVRGKPLPESARTAGILVGIVLVVALMAFALFHDVLWFLKGG
jgi:regulator of sigma E protease